MSPIGLIQIIKQGARDGNTRVTIELGTLAIPIKEKDADSIELIEVIINDPELDKITWGETEKLFQEGIFQLQILKKTRKVIKPKAGVIGTKAGYHVERLLNKNHTEDEALEIFQDAIVWFNLISILKYTDEQQAKKTG